MSYDRWAKENLHQQVEDARGYYLQNLQGICQRYKTLFSSSSSEMAVQLHLTSEHRDRCYSGFASRKANLDFVRLVVEENQAGKPFSLDDLGEWHVVGFSLSPHVPQCS